MYVYIGTSGKETKKRKSTFVKLTPLTLSFPTPI